ncbi:MAG TPA: YCF48-related protein, partial [Candidatus Limnocylindrales bacterium]|nr:YCF48-related protein [Candidatus Limnocylindrales bacterium]
GRLSRAPLASQAEPAGAGPSGAQSVGPSFGFVDLQDGWALDGTGLERTIDGGATWTTVTLPSEAAKPYAVDFRDARDGCLLAADHSDFFGAWRTTDGGLTWAAAPGAQDSVEACAWDDAGDALLAAARQAAGPTNDLDLSRLAIADRDHAWVVGPQAILRTTDGGARWQMLGWSSAVEPAPFDDGAVAVTFPDAEHGWVLTVAGRILQTSDAGRTWTEMP